jgi:hypothetical protein
MAIMKVSVTIDDVVELLNELNELDASAMRRLIEARHSCNRGVADHPTVQVMSVNKEGPYKVGMLGFLNGLFGVDGSGSGPIQMVTDDDTGAIVEFRNRSKDALYQ